MGKHSLEPSDDDSDIKQDEQGPVYHVEVITQVRVTGHKAGNKKFEYYVKWHGYTSDDDTWEPQKNLKGCKRLLKSFWKNVGKDRKENPGPPGTVYTAEEEWIDKERRYFTQEKRKEEKERPKKAVKLAAEDDAATQSRSVEASDVLNLFQDVDNGSDASDVPLNKQIKSKGKEKAVPKATSSTAKASSSTRKSGVPQRPSIQTSPNTASTSKYFGMKITKKPAGIPLADPLASPTALVNDILQSRPQRPTLNTATSASSPTVARKDSPAQEAKSSKQFLPPRAPPAPAATTAVSKPENASAEDVDNFLATVMPFSHSESQKPENLASQPQPTPTKTSIPVPTGLKFQKRWSWNGELFIDYANAADKLCEITIHSTSETSEIGFRLAQFLDDRDSLRFSKSYTRSELNLVIRALKKVDQIAKIGHQRAEDKEPLTILLKYLIQKNLVVSCPAINHMGHVAEMIVFPSANKDLCTRLNVPLYYKSADCLLVALIPWHVAPSKYDTRWLRPDELRDTKFEKELEEMRKEFPSLASKPTVETALRILGFDFSFVKFLPSRKYCVWSYQVDPKPIERGRKFPPPLRPETKALFDVLSFLKAENVGYDNADARIVFVHVGAVRSMRRLPGIVERRCDKPEVQFVTYGTHESVHPETMSGFHEIYPLGGIVTFTATALLENPISVAEIIEQVHKHPHWECYILPSVLAVFVRLSCPGEDPLSVYAREPYHFGRILELIEEGKVALMQSPGLLQGPRSENEDAERDKWILTQFASIAKTPMQLLEDCWSTFVAEYSNNTETELGSTIEREIVKDLTNLQTQQTIRENYRRFVVIKAMQDEHIKFSSEGFEWRAAQEFSFGDGFPVHTIDLTRGSEQPMAA